MALQRAEISERNPNEWLMKSGHPEKAQDIRLVVDAIPGLVWSTRPDGSAEFFNQRWLEYTGLSAEQALNWGWKVAIHPDDLPRMLEIFHEALSLGRSFEVEGRFRRRDGEFRWFLFRGSPLLDGSGKSRQVVRNEYRSRRPKTCEGGQRGSGLQAERSNECRKHRRVGNAVQRRSESPPHPLRLERPNASGSGHRQFS